MNATAETLQAQLIDTPPAPVKGRGELLTELAREYSARRAEVFLEAFEGPLGLLLYLTRLPSCHSARAAVP